MGGHSEHGPSKVPDVNANNSMCFRVVYLVTISFSLLDACPPEQRGLLAADKKYKRWFLKYWSIKGRTTWKKGKEDRATRGEFLGEGGSAEILSMRRVPSVQGHANQHVTLLNLTLVFAVPVCVVYVDVIMRNMLNVQQLGVIFNIFFKMK